MKSVVLPSLSVSLRSETLEEGKEEDGGDGGWGGVGGGRRRFRTCQRNSAIKLSRSLMRKLFQYDLISNNPTRFYIKGHIVQTMSNQNSERH